MAGGTWWPVMAAHVCAVQGPRATVHAVANDIGLGLRSGSGARPVRTVCGLDAFLLAHEAVENDQRSGQIETSTGTYIGEGYLMHNCYGNRMADTYDGSRDRCTTCAGDGQIEHLDDDGIGLQSTTCTTCNGTGLAKSKRYTYRIALGHDLTDGSAAGLQWGHEYRELHRAVWAEAHRVLKPRGLLMLNISDHIRNGAPQGVDIWHASALGELGFRLVEQRPIITKRSKNGANRDARALCEWLLIFRRGRP